MNLDFKQLQKDWKSQRKELDTSENGLQSIYKKIKNIERENFYFYYGTIYTLSITLIVISLFFYFVAPVQKTGSRIGVFFMIGGLFTRIILEIISTYKARKINKIDAVQQNLENSKKFHQYRKFIHQVIAPIIIVLYTIGFFLITPEFSIYLKAWQVILIDTSYIIMGIILFFTIRKSVRKEMTRLKEIKELKSEITN